MAESAATAGAQCTLCTAMGNGSNWQNALSSMVSIIASARRACVNPDANNFAGLGNTIADVHWYDIPRVSFNNARLKLAVLSCPASLAAGGRRS